MAPCGSKSAFGALINTVALARCTAAIRHKNRFNGFLSKPLKRLKLRGHTLNTGLKPRCYAEQRSIQKLIYGSIHL